MSNPITYADLFDELGPGRAELEQFAAAVTTLNKSYHAFAKTSEADAQKIAGGLAAIASSQQELRASATQVNVMHRQSRASLEGLHATVLQLVQDQQHLKDQQRGLTTVQKDTEAATKGLTAELRKQQQALKEAYSAQDLDKAKAHAQQILVLKQQTEELNRALRGANSTLTAAAGSYRALENEGRVLELRLRSLAGGMDSNTEEAQQMKARLGEVNQALIQFGKETGNGRVNVGRYAEDIREAVTGLERQRTTLLANVAALRTQATATGLSAEQQTRLQQELTQTEQELTQNTQALRAYGVATHNSHAAAGKLQGGTAGLSTGIGGLASSLASAYFGLNGLIQVMGQAKESYLEFELAQSSLAAITGAGADDLQYYAEQAGRLGPAVGQSAAETLKAFELIGSAQPELLKSKEALVSVTEQALLLAAASGDELPAAAEALTGVMNQFQAPAREAARYVNALAAGAKEGSATIPQAAASLKYFGVNAAAANVSVEQSVALIQVLAERSVKGEQAGTQLRGVFAKLAAGAKETNPEIVGLDTALDNLGKKNLSTAQLTKLFGLENANAAAILIDGREKVKTLTTALTGTQTASEQAAEQLDNVATVGNRLAGTVGVASHALLGRFAPAIRAILGGATELVQKLFGLNKSFSDTVQASGSLIQTNQRQAQSAQELLQRYTTLTEMGLKPTAKEKRELDAITLKLRDSLGESVVAVDKETGALTLNKEAVREAIKQRLLLANQTASTLALQANAAKERQKVADRETAQIQRELATRRAMLKEEENLTGEQAQRLNLLDQEMPGRIKGYTQSQIKASEMYVNTQTKLGISIGKSRKASEEYAEAIAQLTKLGFDAAFVEKVLAGETDKTTVAEQRSTAAVEKKKKAVADVAAEEYRRHKQQLEFQADDFARQAANPANPDEVQLRALQKEKDIRAQIAKLDQVEGGRLAGQANQDKINGERATYVTKKLLSEKYDQDVRSLNQKLSKDELAVHNATLNALAQADRLHVEQQLAAAEEVRDNELSSYADSQRAAREAADYKIDLARLTRDEEVRAAQGAADKIALAQQKFEAAVVNSQKGVKDFDSAKAIQELVGVYAQQGLLLEDARGKQLITEQDYAEQVRALEFAHELDIIEALEREYGVTADTLQRKAALRKKYNEQELEDDRAAQQKRQEIISASLNTAQQFSQAYFDIKAHGLDAERAQAEASYQAETQAAGENLALKAQAEETYRRRKAALDLKQFKLDQRRALAGIAISTAQAVIASIAASPVTFGLPFSAFALATGLAETAVVLSQQPPIPQYFKGREGGPAEWAVVAERGPEMITGRSGGSRLVEQPQLTYLQAGDTVYTADQTRQLLTYTPTLTDPAARARFEFDSTLAHTKALQQQHFQYQSPVQSRQENERIARFMIDGIVQGVVKGVVQGLTKALQERPEFRLTEDGLRLYTRKGDHITEHINRTYKRNG